MDKKTRNIIFFITVLLFFGMFIGNYGNYQLSAVPSDIYAAYSLTDMQFSSIMTAPMIPSIFLSIIVGILVDRYGITKLTGLCLAVSAAGFIVRVFASNYITMFIAMALTGVGCMIINANIAKIASSLYPMEKVGTVVGVLMAGSTASMAVAYATTALFPSLELAFWVTAAASIILMLLWILFVREKHFIYAAKDESAVPVKEALSASLKSKNIWLVGIALFLIIGGSMIISNFQVAAFSALKGYSETLAGTFGTVLMVGAIIGAIVFPVIMSKAKKAAPVILLIAGLAAALFEGIMLILPMAGVYIASFLNGALRSGVLSVSLSFPVLFPEIGPKYAGTAGGLAVTIELIGVVVLPTYIIVPLGNGYMSYFIIGAVCVALGSICIFIAAKISGAYKTKEA